MATTVEAGFNEFLTELRFSPAENVAAKLHRASIEACLNEAFGLEAFFRTGSLGNGDKRQRP